MAKQLDKTFECLAEALDTIESLKVLLGDFADCIDNAAAELAKYEAERDSPARTEVPLEEPRTVGLDADTFRKIVGVAEASAGIFAGMQKLAAGGVAKNR